MQKFSHSISDHYFYICISSQNSKEKLVEVLPCQLVPTFELARSMLINNPSFLGFGQIVLHILFMCYVHFFYCCMKSTNVWFVELQCINFLRLVPIMNHWYSRFQAFVVFSGNYCFYYELLLLTKK